jgi:L-fuconolactonase
MIIDSHQHFWKLERGDYDWLTADLAAIFKNFLPADLKPHLDRADIDGTIVVQATDTEAETEFLLSLADKHDWILGVVGWVDMEAPLAPARIRNFSEHDKFVGIRPMIQGIEDTGWMLKPELASAVEALIEHKLTFDALVLPRHLKPLKTFLHRYPELKVIIDHGAKPEIRDGTWQPWADELHTIATTSKAYCKLSGLVTEAAEDWTDENIKPYARHILEVFGTNRTVFGSDWPVLKLAGTYKTWFEFAQTLVPQQDRPAVFGANALEFYFGTERRPT